MPKGIYQHKNGYKVLNRKSPPPFTEGHKKNLSETAKRIGTGKWRKGKPSWNKGKHIQLNGALKKWQKNGGVPWNKGKRGIYKHTEEIKRKIGEAASLRKGEIHWNWQGGKSFEPYSIDWTNELRISIRERDRYICQLCGEKQGDRAHSVHHVDYNKKNCNPDNLITLCVGCNSKVNKNRKYWTNYFNNKL